MASHLEDKAERRRTRICLKVNARIEAGSNDQRPRPVDTPSPDRAEVMILEAPPVVPEEIPQVHRGIPTAKSWHPTSRRNR